MSDYDLSKQVLRLSEQVLALTGHVHALRNLVIVLLRANIRTEAERRFIEDMIEGIFESTEDKESTEERTEPLKKTFLNIVRAMPVQDD